MSIRWIMALGALWVIATVISCVGEGIYNGTSVVDEINEVTAFSTVGSQGIVAIPVMAGTAWEHLPQILAFDYSWFESGAGFQIIRAIFMCIPMGVVLGLFFMVAPMFQGLVRGLFRI